MKTPVVLLLGLSLAGNAALAYFLVRGASRPDPGAAVSRIAAAPRPAAAATGIDPTVWPAVEATDLPELVSNLRAAGFPTDMVRAIVAGQLEESFAARRKALDPDAANRPFWKTVAPNPQLQLAQRQLYREYDKMLRDVLGDNAEPTDPLQSAFNQIAFGTVPAAKLAEVKAIVRNFAEKQSDLYSAGGIVMITTTEREKVRELEKERDAAIAEVLTPQEYAEYELRASSTATSLRYQLTTFDPTEQEFRTICQMQRAFDLQYPSVLAMGALTPEQSATMRQRSEAQKLLTDQIKAALGPERGEEYVRSLDYNYQQTARLVGRLELPAENARQVYAVQKEFEPRVAELRGNRSLSAEQRNQQLAALQEEATAKVAPLLGGARGLEAYRLYGGTWLRSMMPPPPPTPAAARK
jgi:hypothetical protein